MLVNVLYFIFVWGFSDAGAGVNPDGSTYAAEQEERMYPCWRDLRCFLGEEEKMKMIECRNVHTAETLGKVLQYVYEASNGKTNKEDANQAAADFCAMEEKSKREIFTLVLQKILDEVSVKCLGYDSDQDPVCEIYKQYWDCFHILLDEYSGKGECGQDINMKKGLDAAY